MRAVGFSVCLVFWCFGVLGFWWLVGYGFRVYCSVGSLREGSVFGMMFQQILSQSHRFSRPSLFKGNLALYTGLLSQGLTQMGCRGGGVEA